MSVGDVAVGLCTYNRGGRIRATLESLISMDRMGGRVRRIMVIDNGSTDSTGEHVRSFIGANKGSGVSLVREMNPGKSAAMRRFFKETDEETLLLIDDDCVAGERWAVGLVGTLDEVERAGVVGGPVAIRWERGPSRLARIYERSLGGQDHGPERRELGESGAFLGGASLGVRRTALNESGWIDRGVLDCRRGERHESGEDAELCVRVRRRGWEIWYEPGAVVETVVPREKQTKAHLSRLRESIRRSEPVLAWLEGGIDRVAAERALDAAERELRHATLFDWRIRRRAIRLAERRGTRDGWARVVELASSRER